MKEIVVDKNESNQRMDRFLKKYLGKASTGFIYKMLRKRNIKLNNKKVNPETTILEGDTIQLYLADETIEKFRTEKKPISSKLIPKIIYEDDNIILINKDIGVLSHGAGGEFEENIVDSMVSYLIEREEYIPRLERTFTPSICNRLDRNTSGIIIGAKNYESLRLINKALKNQNIERFYKAIVKGKVEGDFQAEAFLYKDEDRNLVTISESDEDEGKKIITKIKLLGSATDYSLLEVELITGRTHQIRGHLSSLGHPIIGDRKYGDKIINNLFRKNYELDNQWLHGYKITFNGLEEGLEYLNGKSFEARADAKYEHILKTIFEE